MVPQENSKFCFPLSPDVSLDFMLGNIRTQGKTKPTVYPHLYLCTCILICTYVLVYMYMHNRYVIHVHWYFKTISSNVYLQIKRAFASKLDYKRVQSMSVR